MAARRLQHSSMSAEAVDLVASRFRVLGEPLRIRILQALEGGEMNVTRLVDAVGSTQPNVSKHLRILQENGLVGRRQEGSVVYCHIADPSVFDLCENVCGSLQARFAQQARVVRNRR